MKQTRLSALLLAALSFVACQDDPTDPDAGGGSSAAISGVTFRGTSTFAATGSSKEAFDMLWQADADRIGLFVVSGETVRTNNAYYAAATGTEKTTTFVSPAPSKSLVWDEGAGAQDIYAYYPFRMSYSDPHAVPVSIPAAQSGAAGDVSGLRKMIKLHASALGVTPDTREVDLDFRSFFAIVELKISTSVVVPAVQRLRLRADAGVTLAFADGTIDLTSGAVTLNPEVKPSNLIEYTFSNPVSFSTTPVSVFLAVNPLARGLNLDVEVDYGIDRTIGLGRIVVPETGIEAGMVTGYDLAFVYEGPVSNSVNLSADGTANTYIVNKAGTSYRFRADVKGNGVARTFSWTEADGTQITRSYGDGDLAIAPADVRLLWYNSLDAEQGWVDRSPVEQGSVTYEFGWCSFSTPEPFVEGNAVLAAYDTDGTVLWSWNIWALENYDADAAARQVAGFVFMDRNLGAMAGADAMNAADKAEAAHAIGNYYQWGRKDPFPAPAEYDDTGYGHTNEMFWGVPTYTPEESLRQDFSSSTWGGSADMMFGSDAAANSWPLSTKIGSGFDTERGVAESVKYPYRWMSWTGSDCAGGNYFWMLDYNGLTGEMKNGWRYLWGAPEFQGENALADNLKTIYDPCPVGWKVSSAKGYATAFRGAEATKWNGRYSAKYDLYFPATGQRQAGFGGSQIRSLGGTSMVALSSANVDAATLKRADGSSVTSWNTYPGAGYNVRCIREEVTNVSGTGPRCVLIGNSITEVWAARTNNKTFFTDNDYLPKGISGETSGQIKARFDNDVLMNDPACVHIACGVNDMAENDGKAHTNEEIFENIKEMAEKGAAAGMKVVIGSTPPANHCWWKDEAWNAQHNNIGQRVVELNKLLKAYAEERGFVYADYHTALKDDDNDLKVEYRISPTDHVHPGALGYAVMEKILKEAVDKALYDPNAVKPGGGTTEDFEKWEGWQ